MTYTRLDVEFHAHPKALTAWHDYPPALGLHLLALSHATCFKTDGHVCEAFVRSQLPRTSQRSRAVEALVGAELWAPAEPGWVMVDYLGSWGDRERITRSLRQRVIARDGYVCQLCGGVVAPEDTHIDHRLPVACGGRTTVANLQVAHSRCNMRKGARPQEAMD